MAEIYWVPTPAAGRVAVVGRPRGGDWLDDEMAAFARADIQILVSALVDEEMRATWIERQGEAATAVGIEFRRLPVANMGVPAGDSADPFLRELAADIAGGRSMGVHCFASVGRSPMIAASVLVLLGMESGAAWSEIQQSRGREVPDTLAQRLWVERFSQGGRVASARARR